MRRVVVTGLGVVSPLGCELQTFWGRVKNGQSGIRRISKFDATNFASQVAGEVQEFDVSAFIDRKEQRRMDEFSWYGIAASKMAVKDAGLDMAKETAERCGVIFGSGIGGLKTLEVQHNNYLAKGPSRCSPFMIPQMISNIVAGLIAIDHGFKGPNYSAVSACATATHCLGLALRTIQHGEADVVLSGGTEAAITELGVGGFAAMGALSSKRNDTPEKASRPFDRERDGFVIGEGAATLILEELEHAKARGARIYAELCGSGMTCDAFHMTAPDENGTGAARAMAIAMQDAKVDPSEIGYINAHGTSTPLNDKIETKAIKLALGEANARKVMISSSKSMTGHLLGAAGAIESVVCCMTLTEGVVSPTINLENPDPECDLDYVPNTARQAQVRACINNSLGFGGHNCSLVFKKYA